MKSIGKNGYFLVIDDFLLYEHVEYFINLLKTNNEKDKILNEKNTNDEIIFYNLYYCLKQIATNLENKSVEFLNNSKFVSNLSFLDNLKKNLLEFIINKRTNKNSKKQEQIILNLIKFNSF
mgnify:CR=1 FL=1